MACPGAPGVSPVGAGEGTPIVQVGMGGNVATGIVFVGGGVDVGGAGVAVGGGVSPGRSVLVGSGVSVGCLVSVGGTLGPGVGVTRGVDVGRAVDVGACTSPTLMVPPRARAGSTTPVGSDSSASNDRTVPPFILPRIVRTAIGPEPLTGGAGFNNVTANITVPPSLSTRKMGVPPASNDPTSALSTSITDAS